MTPVKDCLYETLMKSGWSIFSTETKYTVMFDGQYGSTGKGLLSTVFGSCVPSLIDHVTTNAGPNSGHTGYCVELNNPDSQKIVTKHLPLTSIQMAMLGYSHDCWINAGAIVDPHILLEEISAFSSYYQATQSNIFVHQNAAVIKGEHIGDTGENMAAHIASTGRGVGPAQADKINRMPTSVLFESEPGLFDGIDRASFYDNNIQQRELKGQIFVEVAQGFSLGINSGWFPYTTCRECTPAQALADLGVDPRLYSKSIVSLRTYPIRVGNTDKGNSGPVYPDQHEIDFSDIGVIPEYTTVTGRKRRIFTWSWMQFYEMLTATRPDALFLNFMNYLDSGTQTLFAKNVIKAYEKVLNKKPDFVLLGYGPFIDDVYVLDIQNMGE